MGGSSFGGAPKGGMGGGVSFKRDRSTSNILTEKLNTHLLQGFGSSGGGLGGGGMMKGQQSGGMGGVSPAHGRLPDTTSS